MKKGSLGREGLKVENRGARSWWKRLLEIGGLGGQSEGVRDKNRASERKHGRSGVGSVMVRNQKQVGRVTRGERGQQVS